MFGLFGKKAPECDWCGSACEGGGVVVGELQFCSQACADQKNAPPSVHGNGERPAPSRDLAHSELAIAAAELEQYDRLAQSLHLENDVESEFMDSQNSYFRVWECLDSVRGYIVSHGGAVAHYDKQRAFSVANADSYDIVTVRNFNGDTADVGTATFNPDNGKLAAAALATIRQALDGIGPR